MKLCIEKAVYGGAGLARDEGKAVFVRFTLPGELVEAHVVEDRTSYANAKLDSVLFTAGIKPDVSISGSVMTITLAPDKAADVSFDLKSALA